MQRDIFDTHEELGANLKSTGAKLRVASETITKLQKSLDQTMHQLTRNWVCEIAGGGSRARQNAELLASIRQLGVDMTAVWTTLHANEEANQQLLNELTTEIEQRLNKRDA